MTINYDLHEYTKVGNYSNVLYEWHPNESHRATGGWGVELHEKMQPLIHKLAMAHPDWTFVMRGGGSHTDGERKVNVSTTCVLCEGEVIGSIELDIWKNGTPFEISCRALLAKRQRRGGAWTTKPEKAYKLVEQNFTTRSTQERLKAGRSEVRGTTGSQYYRAQRMFNETMEKINAPLAAYIQSNMDAIKAALPVTAHAHLDAIPRLARQVHETSIVSNAAAYDSGAYVLIRDGKYYVMGGRDDTYSVLAPEELPGDMAAKLGMLKALDTNDEIIEGVGVRAESGIYFIL